MEFQFRGGNCVRISTKEATVFTDPKIPGLSVKTDKSTAILATQEDFADAETGNTHLINTPGEYELSGLSIKGIAARAHMDEEGKRTATIYKLMASDINVLVSGHIHPKISDDDLEKIGTIDILIVPVGGNGYTLDGVGAVQVIRAIEPKIVIPTHYEDKAITYEVPQNPLSKFLEELGIQKPEEEDKLKIKNGVLPESMSVAVLSRTA